MTPDPDPLLGSDVDGRFHIESVLADGGTARIYQARDPSGGRVAVKVLSSRQGRSSREHSRFLRGAALAGRIAHRSVLGMLHVGTTSLGEPCIVMPLANGPSLADIITREAPLEPGRASKLLEQLAAGVAAIHDAGVLHRDLKASNIAVVRDELGREAPRILDLGLAVPSAGAPSEPRVVGTASYMAPERLTNGDYDERSDLYSLGVIYYRMLSGRFPFSGSPLMRAMQGVTTTPPPIAERVPGLAVPSAAEAIALKLLSREAADRYASARALGHALTTCAVFAGAVDFQGN